MLEIASFTAPSALLAASSGATHIELCAHYTLGGTTPSLDTLSTIRAESDIPINIMIRPRGGNFCYSASEFEDMKASIRDFKATDTVDGFVFGVLDAGEGGKVNEGRCRELVELAAPLACTFHRAVDETGNLEAAVEAVVRCGFASVLTSGGGRSALEGVERVRALQERFGEDISIILGGGVRSGNVAELKKRADVNWLHSAAITGEGEEVDGEEVRKMVEILRIA
jgi:copper homeostasis protein